VKFLYTGKERIFDHWNIAFMKVDSKGGDFAEFTEKHTRAVKLFWKKVSQIIKEI